VQFPPDLTSTIDFWPAWSVTLVTTDGVRAAALLQVRTTI